MERVMLDSAVNHSHSWWWDGHVSPKHSRWLKENLADMDLKVKDMLKLIEEDADSFAKRAEMYYKKRPELISLVEEFYRGYRALAERYDHITGELHHVQCSMADVFPNQGHYVMDDVSPRASFINKQSQGHSGKEMEGYDSFLTETGQAFLDGKQTVDTLAFSEEMGMEISNTKIGPHIRMQKRTGSSSGQIEVPNEITKLQKEILSLQQENEILKGDHERGSEQFRVVEEQLLKIQEELEHVQEEKHKLNENSLSHMARINELEEQLCTLKKQQKEHIEEGKALSQKLQSETWEKDKLILEIQNLEAKLQSERQNIQTELQSECSTPEHRNNEKSLANLQDELLKFHHENHNLRLQVMTGVQQLQKANEEIQNLHQALLKSQAENDTMIYQYQQSLKLYEAAENRAKDLQLKMAHVNEENKRIKDDIAGGVLCINIKERAQNLERERNAIQQDIWHIIQRTNSLQDGPITKYNEEQNVSIKLQDESAQTLKFDAVLKNYQQSISQLQEHQKILSIELQARNERLKDADKRIKILEEEISHLQEDNGNLKEKSSSTVVSIKNLEKEVYKLKKDKNSLLNEVTFRVDQRDALQQELYCLKEDRNDLDRRFQTMQKQIQSLGIDAESIQLVCLNLQDISQKLREYKQIGEEDNVNVPQVLQKMEEFIKKNATLENSVASHLLELERLEFEIKLLQQSVQSLQKEKVDLMAVSEQHNDRVKDLEAELESVHNVYAKFQGENQHLKDKLADALVQMKGLEEQTFNWQGEKEALLNKIAESSHQVSHSQKQVDLLEAEGKDLRHKLEEERNNVQKFEIEIEKLQQVICQMDNRNQVLLDECHRLNEKCSSAEEKAMELEKTNSKQQEEHNMFLNSFSSAVEYQQELKIEIEKLQNILAIPYHVEGKASDALNGMELLHIIVENVKKLQTELSHLQEENKKLLNDALANTAHLEQLENDMAVWYSEKESIKEEAAVGVKKLSNLQQEIFQLQDEIKAMGMKLEDGMKRERNLESDLKSLQQSLASSGSARFALEDECQRTLEKYNSTKACLKKSESMLLEMELENQSLLAETLAQISLVTMLENIIIEKDENIQLMQKKLNTFQERSSELENGLQSCATKAEMQEVENQQFPGPTCGLPEEEEQRDVDDEFIVIQGHRKLNSQLQTGSGHAKEMEEHEHHGAVQERDRRFANDFPSVQPKDATIKMAEEDLQQRVSRLEGTKNDKMQPLESENRPLAEHKSKEYTIFDFHKEERILKNQLQSDGVNEVEAFTAEIQEAKELETQNLETKSEEKLQLEAANVDGSGGRSKQVKELQARIRELQVIVRDLQQENIKLKGQRWSRSAVASIMGVKEEHHYMKGQSSRLMLVEGSANDQEEKEVIVHEVNTGTKFEDKVRHEIYLLQEQNLKFWTRVDSVTQQIQKLQLTFEELREKFQKMMQDNKQPKEDTWRVENNAIEKQFRELQDELLLWRELNDTLTKEVQSRFASINRIQAELAATKGGCSADESEEIVSSLSQSVRLQREILSIQEQNSKIADRLQAGSDKARGLEFEVERILLKFQGEMKTLLSDHPKKAHVQRVRVPLRTFLFGKKEHGQKQRAFCACTQPITNV